MDRADGQGRGASAPSGLGEAGEVAEVSEWPRIASAQGVELHRQPPEAPVGGQIAQPKGLGRGHGHRDLPTGDLQLVIARAVHALQRETGLRIQVDVQGVAGFQPKPGARAAGTPKGAERLTHLRGDKGWRRRGGQAVAAVLKFGGTRDGQIKRRQHRAQGVGGCALRLAVNILPFHQYAGFDGEGLTFGVNHRLGSSQATRL